MRGKSLFLIGFLFISVITITMFFYDYKRNNQMTNQLYQNGKGGSTNNRPTQVNNRFNTNTIRVNNHTNNKILQVNSIKRGNHIVKQLNSSPSITMIKHNRQDASHYRENQVTVKFKQLPGKQKIASIEKEINGRAIDEFDSTIVFHSKTLNTSALLEYFTGKEQVVFAEPNYLFIQNEAPPPNDLLYQEHYQWNLPVIHTENGWDITRGSKKVVIAVIDSGVDIHHPDLKKRVIKGYNVLSHNNNPNDDNGHGTHVAGIIASETNNKEGVAGLTWFNKIMPIKVISSKGYGNALNVAEGIKWATDHGADVINLSLGNYQGSAVIHDAIHYAYKNNVVIVSASGNDNSDQPSYPASYPEVLSVAAVDYNGKRASFSNYGDYIDVAAPGVDIPSTYYNRQYAALSGTSMASPHVAGLAGLILSANPSLRNKEVMNIIKESAYDLGPPGSDPYFGSGLIDVQNTLENVH